MKKVMGILSNVLSIILVCPVSFWFFVVGFLFITSIDYSWSISCIFSIISCISFICALPLCITGIVMSFIYRRKDKYKQSYLIQLLPFLSVSIGVFLFVLTMIFENS